MADGKVEVEAVVNNDGLDKGLKKTKSKVSAAAKDINKSTNTLKTAFTQKLGGIASSGGVAAAGVVAAVAAAKKFIETLKESNEAYKVQEKAEKALQKAADNNPYLSGEGVRRLKAYASELQGVSNYGDEGTIDIMAQLASTGRTEAEIMKIMGAAADYAAATHTDLASAAQTLNATYSGMSGALGKQVGEIKDLTEAQLKNGDAIDIIAKKYKGFAQEAADSGTQAKNAFGDFLESMGRLANPMFEALNQMAKSFWENMTNAMNKFGDALEKARKTWVVGADYQWAKESTENIVKSIKNITKKQGSYSARMYTEETLMNLSDYNLDSLKIYLEQLEAKAEIKKEEAEILRFVREETAERERIAKNNREIADYAAKYRDYSTEALENLLNQNVAILERKAIEDELEARREKARKAQEEAIKTAQKAADDYARESNRKLQESLNALEVEARAKGEAVSVQDKYNVYLQSYIDLLTKTEGAIREGFPVEQKRLEQLKEAKKAVDEAADAEKKLAAAIQLTQAATDALGSANRRLTPAEELEAEIHRLDEIKSKIKSMSEEEIAAAQAGEDAQLSKAELIEGLNEAERQATLAKVDAITEAEQSRWDKYASQQQELLEMKKAIDESEILSEEEKIDALKALDESYSESRKQQFADLATEIKGYADQAVSIMQDAASLMLDTVRWQSDAELAELELRYRKGEIGEEEYNEAIAESKKKAAKEQYKIQMWQWSASILQATANIAQGVSMAIAQGGVAGLITGALVAAAGSVQIASIIASKPTPPSFASGGIVPGSSYSGDRVQANVNSGEMILNAAQQRSLWEAANGRGAGGGTNIVINNSASNIVSARPEITEDKIKILIDARVNEGLQKGKYDQSLAMANDGMGGDMWGI